MTRLSVGTKSVLFGAHQFLLHPVLVAIAWTRLYGFPLDPRLWLAFAIHDLGYVGKPEMDGPEGETHPEWAARIMGWLFGREWHDFCLLHSRFYAHRLGRPFSQLCVADKLVIAMEPAWLYVLRVRLSGEIVEYRKGARGRTEQRDGESDFEWYEAVRAYCRGWALEHADCRPDTWTPREIAAAEAREGA
jgi:hypothetical protein